MAGLGVQVPQVDEELVGIQAEVSSQGFCCGRLSACMSRGMLTPLPCWPASSNMPLARRAAPAGVVRRASRTLQPAKLLHLLHAACRLLPLPLPHTRRWTPSCSACPSAANLCRWQWQRRCSRSCRLCARQQSCRRQVRCSSARTRPFGWGGRGRIGVHCNGCVQPDGGSETCGMPTRAGEQPHTSGAAASDAQPGDAAASSEPAVLQEQGAAAVAAEDEREAAALHEMMTAALAKLPALRCALGCAHACTCARRATPLAGGGGGG